MHSRRQLLAGTAFAISSFAFGAAVWASRSDTRPTGRMDARKIGVALVGIGKLTTGQIIPAFANSKNCRLTAFVTGHPDKAKPYLDKFNIPPASIYSYDNIERIADNPNIEL